MKIRNKMIASVTLVVLLMGIVTSGIWYYQSVNTINSYLTDYSGSVMNNTYESIKTVTDNVNYTEVIISNNMDNMVNPLKYNQMYAGDKSYDYTRLVNDRKINEFIGSAYGYKDYLSGICVFPKEFDGQFYKIGAVPKSPEKLYQAIKAIDPEKMERRSVMLMPEPVSSATSSNLTYLVPMAKTITSTSGDIYGYMAVMFDYNILERITKSSLPAGSKLQIVDESGQIVYSNCGKKLVEQPEQGLFKLVKEQSAYNEIEFTQTGWVCRMEIPADSLLGNVNRTILYMMLIYAIVLMLALCLVVYVSYRLTENILVLNHAMQKVSTGDLDVQIDIQSKDEIGSMAGVFNNMTGQLKQLIEEVKETESQKRKAEIDFLQAQINPHFLSNVLNTVTCLAEFQNEDNIARLSSALVELLHSSMKKGGEIITVRDEIHYIQSYVQIEQYCYVDNFDVEYEIEEEAQELYIPRFLLQPIVENALIHSLNELTDRFGELKISAKICDDRLVITIHDNGKGMTGEQIDYALHHGKEKSSQQFTSIGVYNVAERIKLMYGDEYGITYDSVPGEYTDVTLSLPARREK